MKLLDKIIVVGGITCSGKTDIAVQLATKFSLEIVNFDSMCFYRYFNIGTAKPDRRQTDSAAHHLFDIKYPDEEYNAAAFRADAVYQIEEIKRKDKIPLFVGGTGMYMKSLIYGLSDIPEIDKQRYRQKAQEFIEQHGLSALYEKIKLIDPVYAARISQNDSQRITRAYEVYEATGKPLSFYLSNNPSVESAYDCLYFILIPSKERLKSCIMERTKKMIESGLVDEVKNILRMGYQKNIKPFKGIGYKETLDYLDGKIKSIDELSAQIIGSSMKYAKRQATYFKKTDNAIIISDKDWDGRFETMKRNINLWRK